MSETSHDNAASALEATPRTYEEAVRVLAAAHSAGPDQVDIYSLADPRRQTVRLVEVSASFPEGAVDRPSRSNGTERIVPVFAMGPSQDFPYRSEIIQVTPSEWEQIQRGKLKMAKAFLYHAEPEARYSHHVVLSAINRLRSHTVARAAGMKLKNFSRMLDSAKPIFRQIEAVSPSVGQDGSGLTREESERTSNVEYPWQSDPNDSTSWIAPVSYSFAIVKSLRYDPRSAMAVRLLDRLIHAANTILPRP